MELNFPTYNFKVKTIENTNYVFDIIRKRYVVLTPEEWVRQHLIWYLIHDKKYPSSLIAVEKGLIVNGLKKRFDLLVFDNTGKPKLLVECKSPEVQLSQLVFDQIAAYNIRFKVKNLLVTNGLRHLTCVFTDNFDAYEFQQHIPDW